MCDRSRQLADRHDSHHSCEFGLSVAQRFFRAFPIVDIGGRTDEFEDFSFCIAQHHSLNEVPAIGPVLSAERPGFHLETSPRAYSVPKAPRCFFPIVGVDRSHPGLRMRPDEIEGLTGVLEPNSIHEIWGPIRLERPGGYRKMLQQPCLELLLLVDFDKLPCSFRNLPVEFTCDSFPFTEVEGERSHERV